MKKHHETVLAMHPGLHMPEQWQVLPLNTALAALSEVDQMVQYVDLAFLLTPVGELQERLTLDGLHLKGTGLAAWAEGIKHVAIR